MGYHETKRLSFYLGQRTFRIATVSRHSGQLALDVYEIRLPRPEESTGSATITLLPPATSSRRSNADPPPPPFSTAINMPVPMSTINEESPVPPPPRYDEVIVPISVISGSKLSEESIALPLSAPGTGVQPGRHRHSSLPSS